MATGTTFFLLNREEPPPAPDLGGAVGIVVAVADSLFVDSTAFGRNASDSDCAVTFDWVSFSAAADSPDDDGDASARGGGGGGLGAGGCAFALARIEKKKNIKNISTPMNAQK